MAVHKGPASLRPRCTRSGSSVDAIPVDQRSSTTLSITSALERVGGQRHAPAALPLGKTRYPLCGRMDGPQGWSE
jgi:hypothetical protein